MLYLNRYLVFSVKVLLPLFFIRVTHLISLILISVSFIPPILSRNQTVLSAHFIFGIYFRILNKTCAVCQKKNPHLFSMLQRQFYFWRKLSCCSAKKKKIKSFWLLSVTEELQRQSHEHCGGGGERGGKWHLSLLIFLPSLHNLVACSVFDILVIFAQAYGSQKCQHWVTFPSLASTW